MYFLKSVSCFRLPTPPYTERRTHSQGWLDLEIEIYQFISPILSINCSHGLKPFTRNQRKEIYANLQENGWI